MGANDIVVSVLDLSAGGSIPIAVTAAPRSDEATAVGNAHWIGETLPHALAQIG